MSRPEPSANQPRTTQPDAPQPDTSQPGVDRLRRDPLPLRGRTALVTGVSRRAGIGYAVARRLAALGASLFLHHHVPHDEEQPWGADLGGVSAVVDGVAEVLVAPAGLGHAGADLAEPDAPERLLEAATAALGPVDVLICNHARAGGDGTLTEVDAVMLDGHWAVNARSSILLAKGFAARHEDARPGGRIVFLTSGQNLGPMRGEVAYAASKGALAAITATLADELADRGITVNAVNPGPVDTGYAGPEFHEVVRRRFPGGRWGEPDDPARLIAWLATDEARWLTGQVLNSEGGFRRG